VPSVGVKFSFVDRRTIWTPQPQARHQEPTVDHEADDTVAQQSQYVRARLPFPVGEVVIDRIRERARALAPCLRLGQMHNEALGMFAIGIGPFN
jgi:hypothetical protein